MSTPPFKVLIIGGGSCGLALAQGLQKAGIEYTLYERDSAEQYHHRTRDWGSLLHWGTQYMQKCLPPSIWARRSEMNTDPYYTYDPANGVILIVDGKTGTEIKRPTGVEHVARVSREKVRRLLSQGLNISYSKRLLNITTEDDTVTAYFSDNTTATGSVLIGCDGGRSKTREFIVGPEAAKGFDTDYTMINTWTTLPADIALALRAKHPIVTLAQHPDGYPEILIAILDIPSKDAPPETWKFQIYTGVHGPPRKKDLDTNAKAMAFFKGVFKEYAEPYQGIGEAMSEDHVLPVDDGWNFKPIGDFDWDNHGGKMTLAGDAAPK